jgi:hypothetical protein
MKVDEREQPSVEVVLRNKLLQADAVKHFRGKRFSSLHDSNLRIIPYGFVIIFINSICIVKAVVQQAQ